MKNKIWPRVLTRTEQVDRLARKYELCAIGQLQLTMVATSYDLINDELEKAGAALIELPIETMLITVAEANKGRATVDRKRDWAGLTPQQVRKGKALVKNGRHTLEEMSEKLSLSTSDFEALFPA